MYDLTRITNEFHAICEKAQVECNTPIVLNGRLSRCLGRVKIINNRTYGLCAVRVVEFSKHLLDCSDKDISEIIKHEAAHYILFARTHENHDHDTEFRKVCKEIGAKIDTPSTNLPSFKPLKCKYIIYCPTCKRNLGQFQRLTHKKYLNFIVYGCTCKKCKSRVIVKQNY